MTSGGGIASKVALLELACEDGSLAFVICTDFLGAILSVSSVSMGKSERSINDAGGLLMVCLQVEQQRDQIDHNLFSDGNDRFNLHIRRRLGLIPSSLFTCCFYTYTTRPERT